jgi:amidase
MKYLLLILCFSLSRCKGQNDPGPRVQFISKTRVDLIPSTFSNKFSLNEKPVLRIKEGDTIQTETVDAGGADKDAEKRNPGGNPLTGPFYIEHAEPGDILAITLTKVALNRDYAYTTEIFNSRSMPAEITKQFKKTKIVKWKLDRKEGFAYPEPGYEHLSQFRLPLGPFMGCIGVAPDSKNNEILSFFSGSFGGNMDFKAVAQFATIYLPVFHEGAFLYLGDGHAEQGDGELAGNALETSMDVEFTVMVIKNHKSKLNSPRVEDSSYIMVVGLDKTLDDALKMANRGLLDWLQTDYHLSLPESTQVMSTSVEYTIAEIADPEVEVVAKIKKGILKGIKP